MVYAGVQHLAADFLGAYAFVAVGRVGSAARSVQQRLVWLEAPPPGALLSICTLARDRGRDRARSLRTSGDRWPRRERQHDFAEGSEALAFDLGIIVISSVNKLFYFIKLYLPLPFLSLPIL